MNLRKRQLAESRLYVILDKKTLGKRPLLPTASKIAQAGAQIIQLRDKSGGKGMLLEQAFALKKILTASGALFIVNDYLDITKIADADGIHLGQTDASVPVARKILGKQKIIGVSCHSLKQAVIAQKQGADYIGFGPIFRTPTKPGSHPIGLKVIKQVAKKIRIPFFCIGGVNRRNLAEVISSGAKRVAVCRAALS